MTVLLVVKFDFHTSLLLHLFTLPRAFKSKKECVRTVCRFESRLIILAAKSAVYAENVKSNHWMHNRAEQTMPLTYCILYIIYSISYIPALGSSEVLTRSGSLTIAFHCCTNQRHQLAIDTQLHWVPLIRQNRCNNVTFNISMGKNIKIENRFILQILANMFKYSCSNSTEFVFTVIWCLLFIFYIFTYTSMKSFVITL